MESDYNGITHQNQQHYPYTFNNNNNNNINNWNILSSNCSFINSATINYLNCSSSSSENDTNSSSSGTNSGSPNLDDNDEYVLGSIVIGMVLGLIILTTILGNVFVLAAIWMERTLHSSAANYLILSLAVADLMVACLVMPLGAYKEVSKQWLLGANMCDMWTSSDVLSCTASILHLCAIALDRYWAVTSIDYIHQRNPSRIITMIVLIWLIALLVSLAPLFGWKDDNWYNRLAQNECLVSQSVSYQIFGTMSSFYVPLAIILFLYYRIYETARKRIRRRPMKAHVAALLPPERTTTTSLMNSPSPEKSSLLLNSNGGRDTSSAAPTPESTPLRVVGHSHGHRRPTAAKTKRESTETKRERKAAKTLAIITGAFIICWLPFFIFALTMPLCPTCPVHHVIPSVLLWLGWINSTLNPIIYTIFSPDFRMAFKKILFGRHYATRSPVAV